MIRKASVPLFLLLSFSFTSFAQKQLSDAETQNFYRLIKQTKEFKNIQRKVDSVNKAPNETPEDFDLKIITLQTSKADDDHIFRAELARRLAMGFTVESHYFDYDTRTKKIVAVK